MRLEQRSGSPGDEPLCVRRDTSEARRWLRPLARRLARREAATLAAADGSDGVPPLLGFDGRSVLRGYVKGQPMHEAKPASPKYFKSALRLLRALYRRGITHNDLRYHQRLDASVDRPREWKSVTSTI